jgi:multidrug efflux pump subunit AcrB
VRTSFDTPTQSVNIELNPTETGHLGINKTLASLGISSGLTGIKITDFWEGSYAVPVVIEPAESPTPALPSGEGVVPPLVEGVRGRLISELENVHVGGLLGATVPLRQIGKVLPEWNESTITHRNGMRTLSVFADIKRGGYESDVLKKVEAWHAASLQQSPMPDNVEYEYGGAVENEKEIMSPMYLAMVVAIVMMFFILVFHFRKIKMAIIVMLSSLLSVFGAAFGIWVLDIDFGAFAILGIIGLMGIIIRNGIIMFDYTEFLRFTKGMSVRDAAIAAGKRRMRPIFLTSAAASRGVLPMIINQSPMWSGMATIIFFGTLISMVLIVTVMPVVYWMLYRESITN